MGWQDARLRVDDAEGAEHEGLVLSGGDRRYGRVAGEGSCQVVMLALLFVPL